MPHKFHKYLGVFIMVFGTVVGTTFYQNINIVTAKSCKDLQIIFARGSGAERNTNDDYKEFKRTLENKLKTTTLSYEFTDLDYTAAKVDGWDFMTGLGAFISGGESFAFGDSVNEGVENLTNLVNNDSCPDTKYILGGYSQGAMVVIKSLKKINPNKIIYAATFGDPKLYLPEGEGDNPPACRNQFLSNYRIYVPNCHAHAGLLGTINPYQEIGYIDKLGTWCNKDDIMCSGKMSIDDHTSYVKAGLYEDAARFIFDKVAKTFDFKNTISSPHDTIIVIDTSGSMGELIGKYTKEAIRFSKETFARNGRVALYEYRDLNDPFIPIEHCSFETCTIEKIEEVINNINVNGGGDEPESLLSTILRAMHEQNWQYGATKSIVVLSDAGYLNPDRDGSLLADVVDLSRKIDPVNVYIVTTPETAPYYAELAKSTDGGVYTDPEEFSLLTDRVIERFDSLPRVEESLEEVIVPPIHITDVSNEDSSGDITITFETDAEKTLVIINDTVYGFTTERQITITNLNLTKENQLILTPITGSTRGESVGIIITEGHGATNNSNNEPEEEIKDYLLAPNTGFYSKNML